MVVPRSCPIPRVTLASPCDGPIFALSFKRHVHLLHDARGGLFFGLLGSGAGEHDGRASARNRLQSGNVELLPQPTRLTFGSLRSFAGFVISLSVNANFETNL